MAAHELYRKQLLCSKDCLDPRISPKSINPRIQNKTDSKTEKKN